MAVVSVRARKAIINVLFSSIALSAQIEFKAAISLMRSSCDAISNELQYNNCSIAYGQSIWQLQLVLKLDLLLSSSNLKFKWWKECRQLAPGSFGVLKASLECTWLGKIQTLKFHCRLQQNEASWSILQSQWFNKSNWLTFNVTEGRSGLSGRQKRCTNLILTR